MEINIIFGIIAVGCIVQGLRTRSEVKRVAAEFTREKDISNKMAILGRVQTGAGVVHMYHIIFVVVSILLIFRNFPIV